MKGPVVAHSDRAVVPVLLPPPAPGIPVEQPDGPFAPAQARPDKRALSATPKGLCLSIALRCAPETLRNASRSG